MEAGENGVIGFAAGAFKARFGLPPEHFSGQPIHRLFSGADRPALDLALSTTAVRGRLAPLVLRLSDAAATPVVVSGLAMPSSPGRLCFTIGRLPAMPAPGMEGPPAGSFGQLAEERLNSDDGGSVGLLELADWPAVRDKLPAEAHRPLQAEIVEVLARLGGPGRVAGEL